MNDSTRAHRRRILGLLLVLSLCLSAGIQAGPAEDTKQGIRFFDTGDVVTAMIWFRRAAQQGYAPAQVRLGYTLDQAGEDAEAVVWYHKAAEQNHAEGAYRLGQMYALGEGVKKDPEQAVYWISKAAELGLLSAVKAVASGHEYGRLGFPQDHAQAVVWYRKAAAAGDQGAVTRLQKAYAKGELGLAADSTESQRWQDELQRLRDQAKAGSQ